MCDNFFNKRSFRQVQKYLVDNVFVCYYPPVSRKCNSVDQSTDAVCSSNLPVPFQASQYGETSTAQPGSRPLLAAETQSVPHLCEPNRTLPWKRANRERERDRARDENTKIARSSVVERAPCRCQDLRVAHQLPLKTQTAPVQSSPGLCTASQPLPATIECCTSWHLMYALIHSTSLCSICSSCHHCCTGNGLA